ncbi:MAG: Mo-dependent nitrogenase C-terminal domain-containing protein [Synechococcus sp.]|nr:Mo-dependent nitrogenase C-terminal domain-containing protein [Synechococcus sp.]
MNPSRSNRNHLHYAGLFRNRRFDIFQSVRFWLNAIEFTSADAAHLVCRLIPAQCPFARDVSFLGRILFSIPPLCKLNPLYNELVALRFRALNFLVETGEDISVYCK